MRSLSPTAMDALPTAGADALPLTSARPLLPAALRALLLSSVRALPRRAVGLHLAAVAALLAVTWPALDDARTALPVLRGVALLLAAALALAVDEAGAQLLDACPTPLWQRVTARLALCLAAVVPVWAGALALVAERGGGVAEATVTLELLALVALALSVPAALRRWCRVAEPALVAGPLLLGSLLGAAHLPQGLVLLVSTSQDPAWVAAHWRWAGVLVLCVAVLLRALADPATAAAVPRRGVAAAAAAGRRRRGAAA